MDLVLKLREARRMRGLSQKEAARVSGVGQKTISSFETGERINSLKLSQLERLLNAYGLTEAEFFGGSLEKAIAPWELDESELATTRLIDALRTLPKRMRHDLLAKFQLVVETITELGRHGYDMDRAELETRSAFTSTPLSRPRDAA